MMRQNESGNILIIILIAIVLLGSLTAMLTRSGGSTNETGDYEQQSLHISRILKYLGGIDQAINTLRQRGCSENQISFQYDEDNDGDYTDAETYTNSNAPSDLSCHLFHPSGAGFTYTAPDEKWLDSSYAAEDGYGDYFFTGRTCVANVGDSQSFNCWNDGIDNQELLLVLPWVTKELCMQMNNRLGIQNDTSDPPDIGAGSGDRIRFDKPFDGAFSDPPNNDYLIDLRNPNQRPAPTACADADGESSPDSGYHFYHSVIKR